MHLRKSAELRHTLFLPSQKGAQRLCLVQSRGAAAPKFSLSGRRDGRELKKLRG